MLTSGRWRIGVSLAIQPHWSHYHETLWGVDGGVDGDLYTFDGRFRIANFAQTVLRCDPNALICFHDFASRTDYHVIYEIGRKICVAEDLSVFQPQRGRQDAARALIEKYKYFPS